MKTIIALFLSLSLISEMETTRIITGTVYDNDGNTIESVEVSERNSPKKAKTDVNGFYSIEISDEARYIQYIHPSFKTKTVKIGSQKIIDVVLVPIPQPVISEETEMDVIFSTRPAHGRLEKKSMSGAAMHDMSYPPIPSEHYPGFNTESYSTIHENGFRKVQDIPLSTFSIDVDAASYSNMRRFINNGQLPPKDAVRIEELINYFTYDYTQPKGDHPFAINTALGTAPWNEAHKIIQIGLQGKKIETGKLPNSNLVFLLDVSGSMNAPNKLPLLKSSLIMLTNELRPEDKVSIVVYAGAAGLVLPPTEGNDKKTIMAALNNLQAGGSTAGGAGIKLAYKVAEEQFIEGGNNRIILATDGDFNIGASSDAEMERLIEDKRKSGVFLTVLGFGMGNYKDSKMETLADKGNGNYAYIDNIREAKKVLVSEFGGTLFTIAKDVKLQVEFNPALVQAYRLIGYENRLLNDEDFNDDKKDAGELGSGHTVTALYEVIPTGVESQFVKHIDPLKYQETIPEKGAFGNELLTVKFRYKEPEGSTSKLITQSIKDEVHRSDQNLNWAMAVAGFGMLLRDSEFKGDLTYENVLAMAKESQGKDENGYRKEFIELVDIAARLKQSN